MRLDELRSKYRTDILAIAGRRKAEDVRVFGSVARGEGDESSDIDFLVHFQPEASLFDHGGLYADLEQLLGCKIDVIDDEAVKPRLKSRIFSEAVPL